MIRLGRIEMTGGFLLLLAWLNYLDREFLLPMALAACGAHELGHLAAIRLLGGAVRRMRFTAVGAELELDCSLGYWQEGASALAGPGVNLLLAAACCGSERWMAFTGLNLALALFNLLPVGRLDGDGPVLHAGAAGGPGLVPPAVQLVGSGLYGGDSGPGAVYGRIGRKHHLAGGSFLAAGR